MKVYRKLNGLKPQRQYSFVNEANERYYCLIYSEKEDEWFFRMSGDIWMNTWTGQHSIESNWLELLVVTGWSEARLEKEIQGRVFLNWP